jgi:cell division protein FtsZ
VSAPENKAQKEKPAAAKAADKPAGDKVAGGADKSAGAEKPAPKKVEAPKPADAPKPAAKKEEAPTLAAKKEEAPKPADPNPFMNQGFVDSFTPKIVVVGVGGAGGNAVNNMIARNLQGVEFVVCNTDAQHLATCLTDNRVQLGTETTGGLGCGANPEMGRLAAEESREQLLDVIGDANMVFVTAGMGGGTGTGAAPAIANLTLQEGMLTVAVVTKPFNFEGKHRMNLANEGIMSLQQSVDTMIVVPNQNLMKLATPQTSLMDAFRMADDVLLSGVKSITDLMVCPGLINLDFADVETVMQGAGNSMMGTGEAEGADRALMAAEMALSNPLLGDVSISSAKGMLVNITGGPDMTLMEVDEAARRVTSELDDLDANIIFGSAYDNHMEGKIRVCVVATGLADGSVME